MIARKEAKKRIENNRKKNRKKASARSGTGKDPILIKHPLGLRSRIKSSLDVNVCGAGRLGVFVEVIFCKKYSKKGQNLRKIPNSPGNSRCVGCEVILLVISDVESFLPAAKSSAIIKFTHGDRIEEFTNETKTRAEEITSTGSRGRFAGV